MGLIIDTSVIIAAERRSLDAAHVVGSVQSTIGEQEIAISVVTLIELAHGAARADTAARKSAKDAFIADLMRGVPAISISPAIALRAGALDGQTQRVGVRIPLSDLLIAVTAMEMGYAILTANPRHFNLVPGLSVRII